MDNLLKPLSGQLGPRPDKQILLLCANTMSLHAMYKFSLSRVLSLPKYRWARARVIPLPEQRHHQLDINMCPV